MSEFLMVVPEGYTEIPDADAWVRANDEAAIASFIAGEDWNSLSQLIEDGGFIEPNTQIVDARLFNEGGVFRFWFKQ